MQYITTAQAAEKWGITTTRVTMLATKGKIPGAKKLGHQWMIPVNAGKPADGRTKEVKAAREIAMEAPQPELDFRFPIYLNYTEEDCLPPLSEEEKLLRRAEQAFYAGSFEEAQKLLLPLCDEESDRYVRQTAIILRSYLAVYSPVDENYDALYYDWKAEMAQDFPYKKEMLLLRSAFELDYGYYKPIFEGFRVEPDYPYHPSVQYALALIALIPIEDGKLPLLSKIRYDTQELMCQMMEREGHIFEEQQLHLLLLIVYQLKGDTERMRFHIRRALQIAMERELFFYPAYYYGFYPEAMQEVLAEFPAELGEKISALGKIVHESYNKFTLDRKEPSFLGILSEKEFEYAFLASQGFTGNEIAQKLKVSRPTVALMFKRIYGKLKVNSRRELRLLINHTHGGSEDKKK